MKKLRETEGKASLSLHIQKLEASFMSFKNDTQQ